MSEESILLKLKREFETNEAVKLLLKMVSGLETEIGILKSERDELEDKLRQYIGGGGKGKKEWLKDELIADMQQQIKNKDKNCKEYKKSMNDWRNKYFSLFASSENSTH